VPSFAKDRPKRIGHCDNKIRFLDCTPVLLLRAFDGKTKIFSFGTGLHRGVRDTL
jgi:hypothetical protein